MNEILIIGGNHQNPLGVIEALGQKGLQSNVIILSNYEKSFVLKSKYVKRGWICKSEEEAINAIISTFTDTNSKAVCIACNDDASCLLNQNYDKLKDVLYIPGINEQGSLSKWMNKQYMVEAARSIGLNIPKTWIISNENSIPSDIIYPCITKSITSVHNGKLNFNKFDTQEQLLGFVRGLGDSYELQVQQYIDSEFEFQYLGLSLNKGEEIIIPGRTHIEATSHFNNLTFLKYQKEKIINDSRTLTLTYDFIKNSSYSGLFSVEFMHGKDGKDYFLEMNFRNDGNGIVVTSAGTNLPYIWYLYCTGGDYIKEINSSHVEEVYSCPEDSYLISMFQGDISFKQWYQAMKKTTCWITYFKEDTKPFWALLNLQKGPILKSFILYILRLLRIKK